MRESILHRNKRKRGREGERDGEVMRDDRKVRKADWITARGFKSDEELAAPPACNNVADFDETAGSYVSQR